jgi:hypothetical protein
MKFDIILSCIPLIALWTLVQPLHFARLMALFYTIIKRLGAARSALSSHFMPSHDHAPLGDLPIINEHPVNNVVGRTIA